MTKKPKFKLYLGGGVVTDGTIWSKKAGENPVKRCAARVECTTDGQLISFMLGDEEPIMTLEPHVYYEFRANTE